LLDAFLRLINLLDAPERIPVLAPMIIREIYYFLLIGPQGEDFRLLGTAESQQSDWPGRGLAAGALPGGF
jgi:hypothetical protein